MNITFLGTGTSQGVPVIACNCEVCKSNDPCDRRLRASVLVEVNSGVFVIDTGPDFREQMLREKVQYIDAVILTHGHKDHIGGLDDLRAFNFILKRPIDVYAREDVQDSIRNDFSYAFARDRYPGVPQINLHTIGNEPFRIKDAIFTPIDALHFNLHVFGYRIGDFTYLTDVSYLSGKEKEKMKGSKVIVINALRKKEHYSHFNLDQALEVLHELKPEQGYLTHLSHQMGLHKAIQKELPPNVFLAYDGLKLEI